jgi:hypothetical protein
VDERKALRAEIKDADKGLVQAVFATLEAKDKDGDWTVRGAFGEQQVRVSAYGHSSWTGELPVGKGRIYEEGDKAVGEFQFFMDTERGREHFAVVKNMGELQEWSYGFDVLETGELTDELDEKGVRRVLAKLRVHEVSPVLLGAGIGTHTLAVKSEEKQFEIQTLIFPKSKWDSLDAAKSWASEHDFSAENVDETDSSWRFRQADADDFERLRTICLNPDRDTSMDDCKVKAVGGPKRKIAEPEAEKDEAPQALQVVTDLPISEHNWDGSAEFAAMEADRLRSSSLLFIGGDPGTKENYKLLYRDKDGRINASAVRSAAARIPELDLAKEIRESLQANISTLMDLLDDDRAKRAEVERRSEAAMRQASEEEWRRFQRNMRKSGRKL